VFDRAFTETVGSRWVARVMGEGLPADVDPYSFITSDGLHAIAEVLAGCRGESIVDLACGRGGPGLWLARTIGASLIGVDFSPVGIEHARQRAAPLGGGIAARYVLADAATTGLPSGSAAGVVCIDAIQLMDRQLAVMKEVHRLLLPGGRAVFTTWEDPKRLPDLRRLFESAGLEPISVETRPDWLERERRIFEQAIADAPTDPDDAGLQDLASEAVKVLPEFKESRRVLGIARRPGAA